MGQGLSLSHLSGLSSPRQQQQQCGPRWVSSSSKYPSVNKGRFIFSIITGQRESCSRACCPEDSLEVLSLPGLGVLLGDIPCVSLSPVALEGHLVKLCVLLAAVWPCPFACPQRQMCPSVPLWGQSCDPTGQGCSRGWELSRPVPVLYLLEGPGTGTVVWHICHHSHSPLLLARAQLVLPCVPSMALLPQQQLRVISASATLPKGLQGHGTKIHLQSLFAAGCHPCGMAWIPCFPS